MNHHEAKAILETCRPGGKDAPDSKITAALKFAQSDPELAKWFANRQAFDAFMCAGLKSVPIPAKLKDAILNTSLPATAPTPPAWQRWWARCEALLRLPVLPERQILNSPLWRRWEMRATLAASAAILVLAAGLWLTRQPATFSCFREQIVADSWDYARHLDVTMPDMIQARLWLSRQNVDSSFALPPPLANARVQGCRVLEWRNHKVALLCLLDGPRHLHLFVADRSSFPDAPLPNSPQFARCDRWQTASWTQDGHTYVLSGMKCNAFVQKFRRGGLWLFAAQKESASTGRPG